MIRGEPIRLDQGRDLVFTIDVMLDDETPDPTAADAESATLTISSAPGDDATVFLTASLGDGLTADVGAFEVHILGADTQAVGSTHAWGRLVWTRDDSDVVVPGTPKLPESLGFPLAVTLS